MYSISLFVVSELNEANQAQKPVLAMLKPGIERLYGLDTSLNRVEKDFETEFAGDEIVSMVGKFEP